MFSGHAEARRDHPLRSLCFDGVPRASARRSLAGRGKAFPLFIDGRWRVILLGTVVAKAFDVGRVVNPSEPAPDALS